MNLQRSITNYALEHHELIISIMVLYVVGLGAFLPTLEIDTDLENLLPENAAPRIFHALTKREFALHPTITIGIINEKDPNGVFNVTSLAKIHALTEYVRALHWPDPQDKDRQVGVVEADVESLFLVDYVSPGGPDKVRFERLMARVPATEKEARLIRAKVLSHERFKGWLVSEDGKALCIYLPLTDKGLGHEIAQKLRHKISEFEGDEVYRLGGLYLAEDIFGRTMLNQMVWGLAFCLVLMLILLWAFLGRPLLMLAPIVVALVSVICTLGLMSALGYSFNAMTCMVPLCVSSLAVAYSGHILSEFLDANAQEKGHKQTMMAVMDRLFSPMLHAALISAVGLACWGLLSPTTWVRTFGVSVALGSMIAWFSAVSFVPAHVVLLQRCLPAYTKTVVTRSARTSSFWRPVAYMMHARARPILISAAIILGIAAYGMTQISFNSDPVQWLASTHSLRRAHRELSRHFIGTYQAHLVFEDEAGDKLDALYLNELREALLTKGEALRQDHAHAMSLVAAMEKTMLKQASKDLLKVDFLDQLSVIAGDQQARAQGVDAHIWRELAGFWIQQRSELDLFKDPDLLRYIADLQDHLLAQGLIAKSRSLADIVKDVHQAQLGGRSENRSIPNTSVAVGHCLSQLQGSHRPEDLWHFVTRDFKKTNVRLQLRKGGSADLETAVLAVQMYAKSHPTDMKIDWAGLPYIHSLWQTRVFRSLPKALAGSLVMMFVVMALLLRSPAWGLLGMLGVCLPLAAIYGTAGLISRDYGVHMAVLSIVTVGISVHFVIHYLVRARAVQRQIASRRKRLAAMLELPARGITRTLLVIVLGLLPLLITSLVPYQIIGQLPGAVAVLSGSTVLLVLPAVVTALQEWLLGFGRWGGGPDKAAGRR